jgi:hypothetical protein
MASSRRNTKFILGLVTGSITDEIFETLPDTLSIFAAIVVFFSTLIFVGTVKSVTTRFIKVKG